MAGTLIVHLKELVVSLSLASWLNAPPLVKKVIVCIAADEDLGGWSHGDWHRRPVDQLLQFDLLGFLVLCLQLVP